MFKRRHKHYRVDGMTKKEKWIRRGTSVFSILCIAAGLYLFMILRAPNIKPLSAEQQAQFTPEKRYDKQLIIPKIAVNQPINEGDASMLQKGIWHRFPERGDPIKGGNFILSGHRFVYGPTPTYTKQKSYLYNIDKLVRGDTIYVDWHQTRHSYTVTDIQAVKPNALEIENPSDEAKLTLYSCTLEGSNDGRVVIIAKEKDAPPAVTQ